jgi:hypothetical protein
MHPATLKARAAAQSTRTLEGVDCDQIRFRWQTLS